MAAVVKAGEQVRHGLGTWYGSVGIVSYTGFSLTEMWTVDFISEETESDQEESDYCVEYCTELDYCVE